MQNWLCFNAVFSWVCPSRAPYVTFLNVCMVHRRVGGGGGGGGLNAFLQADIEIICITMCGLPERDMGLDH